MVPWLLKNFFQGSMSSSRILTLPWLSVLLWRHLNRDSFQLRQNFPSNYVRNWMEDWVTFRWEFVMPNASKILLFINASVHFQVDARIQTVSRADRKAQNCARHLFPTGAIARSFQEDDGGLSERNWSWRVYWPRRNALKRNQPNLPHSSNFLQGTTITFEFCETPLVSCLAGERNSGTGCAHSERPARLGSAERTD